MRYWGDSDQFRLYIQNYKIIDIKQMRNTFTRLKIFDNESVISFEDKRKTYGSVRRPDSIHKSERKSIFNPNTFYSSIKQDRVKRPNTYNQQGMHIQPVVRDDLCGCQHNLDPCRHIQQLLTKLSEMDMRQQYIRVQSFSQKRSYAQIRRRYFKYLPEKYPEIYHAHITNILSNLAEELTIGQFYTLAWIEYHAKLEHITYFLFTDLRKSLNNKKKFLENLELQLIQYEIIYPQLIYEAKAQKLPLEAFISEFYESVAAIIVPVCHYAVFLKLLLKSGSKVKLRLLILLITKKRQILLNLVRHYGHSLSSLREYSRQLDWQLYFEEL